MTLANKPTIAEILKPYGIASFRDFHEAFEGHPTYMREVYTGRKPLSKRLAIRIRDFTDGGLTADFLFSLGQGNGR